MSKALGFLLTLAVLLFSTNSLNWQGTGNMTQDNMTFIKNYINTNFKTATWNFGSITGTGDTKLVDFATGLSNQLNSQWAPAWNVVVAYDLVGPNEDNILFGYAFRDHWMWYNGIKMVDGYYAGYIIWKDYNCIKWWGLDSNTFVGSPTKYIGSYNDSSSIVSAVEGISTSLSKSEVWLAAKAYADTLASNAAVKAAFGSEIAFSVVMSQSNYVFFYGRICAKGYLLNYKNVGNTGNTGKSSDDWGHALILQMR